MRFSTLSSLFALSLVSTTLAAPPKAAGKTDVEGGKSPLNDAGEKVTDGGSETGTTFNGQHVPPFTEIDGEKIDETIKDGYW